jgi:hypothetical protein
VLRLTGLLPSLAALVFVASLAAEHWRQPDNDVDPMHIITERGIDFDAYSAYLAGIEGQLPPHVAAFARDHRHYALDTPETLHDAWLESIAVIEPAAGDRHQDRHTRIELRLLGAFHDRVHVLVYTGVRRYTVAGNHVVAGHGDLYTHEVRLAASGGALEHEIVFVDQGGGWEATILVECAEFTHRMLPFPMPAG